MGISIQKSSLPESHSKTLDRIVEKDVTSPAVEKFILKVGVMYVYFSVGFPQFPHFFLLCISETFEISLT